VTHSQVGEVRREIDGRVFEMVVDNVAKRDAFTPEMIQQLSKELSEFD